METTLPSAPEPRRSEVSLGHKRIWVIVRRLVGLPIVLIGVSLVLFATSRMIPSDPVRLIIGDSASPEVKQAIRHHLGLDRPAPIQYLKYLNGLIHGDLGQSIRFQVPVRTLITQAFPATLELVVAGAIVTVVVALVLGLLSGVYQNTAIDAISRVLAIIAASSPPFFVGIVCILVFGFYLKWVPISGRGDPPDFKHLIMPAIVLGIRHAGTTARLLRATMIDVLRQDYIRSARSRGIRERTIVLKYALRNAAIPAITDLGVSLADIIGSVILIETIFAWPGIGRLVYLGIVWNDFPLLSGAILVLLIYAVIVNFLTDFLYGGIDPRVRLASSL
jgi:peptide/nickel transport system permease protein